jgi:hypothetical protein
MAIFPVHQGDRFDYYFMQNCRHECILHEMLYGIEIWSTASGIAQQSLVGARVTGEVSQPTNTRLCTTLFVRALVLDNGTDTAAIVSADLIEIGEPTKLRERIARAVGIRASHLIISATQDHSAPEPSFTTVAPSGPTGEQTLTLIGTTLPATLRSSS